MMSVFSWQLSNTVKNAITNDQNPTTAAELSSSFTMEHQDVILEMLIHLF